MAFADADHIPVEETDILGLVPFCDEGKKSRLVRILPPPTLRASLRVTSTAERPVMPCAVRIASKTVGNRLA